MKFRTDFVTNSSSSSFIVWFPNKPNNAQELHDMMFPKGPTSISYYDTFMSSQHVSERVFNDLDKFPRPRFCGEMETLEMAFMSELTSVIEHYYNYGESFSSIITEALDGEKSPYKCVDDIFEDEYDIRSWQVHTVKNSQLREEMLQRLKQLDWNDKIKTILFTTKVRRHVEKRYSKTFEYMDLLTYSDDGGEALFEHGDIFQNLPHIKISHH
jgi:hypothetical protein